MKLIETLPLHDATLKAISIDAEKDVIVITVSLVRPAISNERTAVITARDFQRFVFPRDKSWGASASINRASMSHIGDVYKLELQLQSGDMLEISAKTIVIE